MTTVYKNVFLPNGYKLPRYTIEKRLSSGGFGAVYIARHDNGHTVALKEFLPSLLDCRREGDNGIVSFKDEDSKKKFQKGLEVFFQEADTVAKIRDERVIAILDVFEANGTAYFAMPVEQGETLQRLIKKNADSRISDKRIQQIFIDASIGVQVLHEHGLLHLDIKPGNLWIRPDGSVVVLDLGASRGQEDYHLFGPLARTPGYAAPEQHESYKTTTLTIQTDVYGLAASMFCCVEGVAPEIATKRNKKDVTLLEKRIGYVSSELLSLIDEGLALNFNDRIGSAEEFKNRLLKIPRLNEKTGMLKTNFLGKTPKIIL